MSHTLAWLESLPPERRVFPTALEVPKGTLPGVCARLHTRRERADEHLVQQAAEDALLIVEIEDRFDPARGSLADFLVATASGLLANDLRAQERLRKHEKPVGVLPAVLEKIGKKVPPDAPICRALDHIPIDEASALYAELRGSLAEEDRPKLDLLVRNASVAEWARLLHLEDRPEKEQRAGMYAAKRSVREKVSRRWDRVCCVVRERGDLD